MKTRYLYEDFKDPLSEDKEDGEEEEEKGEKVLADGKSGVSGVTNKTIGGKGLAKHCPLCAFKLI